MDKLKELIEWLNELIDFYHNKQKNSDFWLDKSLFSAKKDTAIRIKNKIINIKER